MALSRPVDAHREHSRRGAHLHGSQLAGPPACADASRGRASRPRCDRFPAHLTGRRQHQLHTPSLRSRTGRPGHRQQRGGSSQRSSWRGGHDAHGDQYQVRWSHTPLRDDPFGCAPATAAGSRSPGRRNPHRSTGCNLDQGGIRHHRLGLPTPRPPSLLQNSSGDVGRSADDGVLGPDRCGAGRHVRSKPAHDRITHRPSARHHERGCSSSG